MHLLLGRRWRRWSPDRSALARLVLWDGMYVCVSSESQENRALREPKRQVGVEPKHFFALSDVLFEPSAQRLKIPSA